MMRVTLIILPLISVFFFPWQLTALLAVVAAAFFPPILLITGVLFELLYGVSGIPYALIIGLVAFLIARFVRFFVKARIIEA